MHNVPPPVPVGVVLHAAVSGPRLSPPASQQVAARHGTDLCVHCVMEKAETGVTAAAGAVSNIVVHAGHVCRRHDMVAVVDKQAAHNNAKCPNH